ncbi:MAG TPA: MFS transporter [Anaerolineae bacterium]|nr:MFS transporter [Anaerolineae bacterium]
MTETGTGRGGRLSSLEVRSRLLQIVYFLSYGSAGAWMPFLALYLQESGLTGAQIGAVMALRPAAAILTQPLWGIVSDVWGRRRALLWGLMLSGLVVLGFGWSASFWFLLVWSCLFAIIFNATSPLTDSLTLDHLDAVPGLTYGYFRIWGSLGWSVVALGSGYVIAGRDMRLVFLISAILLFLSWCAVPRGPLGDRKGISTRAAWRGIGRVLGNRRLLLFLLLVMLLEVGLAPLFSFFPLYMDELGASRSLIGLASVPLGLVELPFFFWAAAIVKRWGHTKTIAITFMFIAARAFLFSVIRDPVLAAVAQVLHAPFSLFVLASVDFVNLEVPQEWRATGQTLLSAIGVSAGGILGNAIAGFLYDSVGTQLMFRVSGFLMVGAAVAMMVLLKERPAAVQEPA